MLKSKLDASVNFIIKEGVGYYEARYVRRRPDYLVCYLSAQSGCRMACRFCHLTATKQNIVVDASNEKIVEQANHVLEYYDSLENSAKVIHFSWMARGEYLENKIIDWYTLAQELGYKAQARKLFPRYTISTIIPRSVKGKKLNDLFPLIYPDIYYSIYSMNPVFRRKWLPNSLSAEEGLDMLAEWQNYTKKIPKLHWAFIQKENDSSDDISKITKEIKNRGLRVDFNIVRYNPYSSELGKESDENQINSLVLLLQNGLPDSKIKIVSRVGPDIFASCGMFISDAYKIEHGP